MTREKAVLMGPFIGEMYWEAGRFAPMLPYMIDKEYKGKDYKYIILTRQDRFDLYGKYANILVPLRIEGDYIAKKPECFRLIGYSNEEYMRVTKKFYHKYAQRFDIIKHIYPDIKRPAFTNKNQFPITKMKFKYKPRNENYDLVEKYLPTDKPLIVLASRFREGFKRNWNKWEEFYNILEQQPDMMKSYNFIICGKEGEYVPDPKKRFYDMNDIKIGDKSSLIGLLLVILENAFFTFGSQSAIPNISLLYKVDVLEFGCQRALHTRTYNITNTPITFIDSKKYDVDPTAMVKKLRILLNEKRGKLKI